MKHKHCKATLCQLLLFLLFEHCRPFQSLTYKLNRLTFNSHNSHVLPALPNWASGNYFSSDAGRCARWPGKEKILQTVQNLNRLPPTVLPTDHLFHSLRSHNYDWSFYYFRKRFLAITLHYAPTIIFISWCHILSCYRDRTFKFFIKI